jgi:hypothetical protein
MTFVQEGRDPWPSLAGRSHLKRALDQRSGLRVGHDRLGFRGLGVTEGRSKVNSSTNGATLCLLPALLELPALHSAKRKKQGHRELAHGRSGIDAKVYDRDLRASLMHTLYKAKRIGNPSPG